MNYQSIYSDFIADRRTKEAALIASGAYSERHHILPRAHAGDDTPTNLIRLTPEDHFFAHLLLAKIHGGSMWYGLMAMCVDRYGKRSTDAGYLKRQRKSYDTARQGYSMAIRERAARGEHHTQTPEFRSARSAHEKARSAAGVLWVQSLEGKAQISENSKKYWAANPMSAERREAYGLRARGRKISDETRAKLSAKQMGVIPSEETKEKMSASHKAREWTEEDQTRVTAANKAQVWTDERRQKVIKSNQTRLVSEETKARISAAHKARGDMAARNKARVWNDAAREKIAAFHRAKAAYSVKHGVPHMKVTKAMIESEVVQCL